MTGLSTPGVLFAQSTNSFSLIFTWPDFQVLPFFSDTKEEDTQKEEVIEVTKK